ncbi:fatty acid amide hydrolase 1-like [Tigriopus californicus]|uniref:fatty acid amide hydrolase 1-like n=1 Tax=Tigriopus californicus TaxID=6832 RepID=UPI0027DA843B|nr:fatty acid amide hydrolase 1-like [Tigriopus californicus]
MRPFETLRDLCHGQPMLEQVCLNWKSILGTGLAIYIVTKLAKRLYQRRIALGKIRGLRERIAAKKLAMVERLSQKASQDPGHGGSSALVTRERLEIISMPLEHLLDQLKGGQLKPIQVLEAFQARALEVTEEHNCVCDFITEARDWALALESVPGDQRGPLYGLPMSIKECYFVKGYDATVGLSRFINQPLPADASIIQHLKELGAVPFCLTNVPQTMKSYGCSNPVFGVTTNPWDKTRSPGGSSGGEACLLALNGSPLGIGSDVGGSLRTPAHFCGVVGLKPTTGRIYQEGRKPGSEGFLVGINSNAGFMSKNVDGIALGMKVLCNETKTMCDRDHRVVPVPWNTQLAKPKRKLKFGWYVDSPKLPISPGCQRAVKLAANLLEKDGHTVVPFHLKHLQDLYYIYIDHILADGGVNAMAWLDGDIIDKSISINYLAWSTPEFLRKTLIWAFIAARSPDIASYAIRGVTKTYQLWRSMKKAIDIKTEILDDMRKQEIDILLGPGFNFPAVPEDYPSQLISGVFVPGIYNVLDFPAGVLPVTRQTKQDQDLLATTYSSSDHTHHLVRTSISNATNMPIGIQVIGKPWEEELVIHAMSEIERLRTEGGHFKL